jgi:predicted lipoprotein with Yx(FWY)xxD motif
MRYTIQLEMLERNAALADREAIALLHDELLLALNAGCFIALSRDDIEPRVVGRSTPQEGVTRYTVELDLEERSAGLGGDDAAALVQQAFTAALNASYFLRICTDDLVPVRLVSRSVAADTWLRAA